MAIPYVFVSVRLYCCILYEFSSIFFLFLTFFGLDVGVLVFFFPLYMHMKRASIWIHIDIVSYRFDEQLTYLWWQLLSSKSRCFSKTHIYTEKKLYKMYKYMLYIFTKWRRNNSQFVKTEEDKNKNRNKKWIENLLFFHE